MFDTKFIMFDTKSIICDTKFIFGDTKAHHSTPKALISLSASVEASRTIQHIIFNKEIRQF